MKRKAKKHAYLARKERVLTEAELKKIAAGGFFDKAGDALKRDWDAAWVPRAGFPKIFG